MMRTIIVCLLASVAVGCSQSHQPPCISGQCSTSILFDAQPGVYAAHDVRYDDSWPSINSQFRQPERLFYQEFINDVQGTWPRNRDYTIRRFRLYRDGSATR